MSEVFTVHCPACDTGFPVDSAKVPETGVNARCSVCREVFRIERPVILPELVAEPPETPESEWASPGPAIQATPPVSPFDEGLVESVAEPAAEIAAREIATPVEEGPGGLDAPETLSRFGRRSPEEKAAHLARVLVSDMVTYHSTRHETALANGTLAEDFYEEIKKSWQEYIEQVGENVANNTDHFRNALNEILAKGEAVFR